MGRIVGRVGVALAVLVVVGVLVGAWYFADQLTRPPVVRALVADNEVRDADDATLLLRAEGFAATPGRWGLQLPDDRHVVLDDRTVEPDGVRWSWSDLVGAPPPRVGEQVRVDEFVWVGTPDAVDVDFEEVTVAAPVGDLPAWWVPAGPTATGTVVVVHGRGATREEALRFLPGLVGAGWNVLVPTYRGDDGAPDWPDGRVRFGGEAWQDVDAAVAWARERTEGPLVPFGISMGGAMVGQFLDRGDTAGVAAVVLDSPVLSLDALLDLQAGLNGVPAAAEPVLLPVVQVVGDLLYGLDSSELEQVAVDGTFDVPVLLIHGDDDQFVPFGPSARFAAARLDDPTVSALGDVPFEVRSDADTTFVHVPGAGHVRSWNRDSDAYDRVLDEFLAGVAP